MRAANDTSPLTTHEAFKLSLITTQPRLPDERYWLLHQRCAAGTATAAELIELDVLCLQKAAEADAIDAAIFNGDDA